MHLDSEVYIEDIEPRVKIPARSRLFAPKPIGIGTPDSESLVSYIVHLAWAHSISPRLLIRSEFVPLLKEPGAVSHAEFFSDHARTLHGTGTFAKAFVHSAAALTSRQDLMLLTSLPWQDIVPAIGTGFMTKHPKWCKACLAGQKANNQRTHFRLSWAYELYEVCSHHHERLVDTCPWCGKHQPFFPYIPDLSRCAHCFGWLGTKPDVDEAVRVNEQQLWVASAIEDIVVNASGAINFATGDAFRGKLSELVNGLADGQKTKFSKMLGMNSATMTSWITKKQKPVFPQLLYFCRQLGILPSVLFLQERPDSGRPVIGRHCDGQLHTIKPRNRVSKLEKSVIHQKLTEISQNPDDCRPLTEITIELEISRKYLIYWFKDLCIQISLRHRQSLRNSTEQKYADQIHTVRNITWYLHCKGQFPSNRKVASMINPLKLSLMRKHLRQTHRETLSVLY